MKSSLLNADFDPLGIKPRVAWLNHMVAVCLAFWERCFLRTEIYRNIDYTHESRYSSHKGVDTPVKILSG
jgi:hypothetical protein